MARGRYRALRRVLHAIQDSEASSSIMQEAVIQALMEFVDTDPCLAQKERAELYRLLKSINDKVFGISMASMIRLGATKITCS
jgi:hypothetical protein